jgi:hypothetical protein
MVHLYHKLSANGLHVNGEFYPSESTSDETVFVSKVPEAVANIYEEQGTGSRNPETFLPPSQGASAQEVSPEVAPKAKPGRKPRKPKVATPDAAIDSASRSEDEEEDEEAPEDTQPEVTE